MVSLVAWYAVLGAVQVTLALWVILAQPRRVLNWAVGILLILWAGSGLMFQLWREATTLADHSLYVRTGGIYQAPSFFLILLVIDRILLPTPKPRAWKGLLVASAAAVPLFAILQPDGSSWRTTVPSVVNQSVEWVVQTAAILFAIRAANDGARSTRERRQAALVGLAFALLMAHGGASQLGNLFWGERYVINDSLLFGSIVKANFTILGTAGLAAALYGFARLPAPFGEGGRVAMRASLLLTILVGVVSYAKVGGFTIVGGRAIVLSAVSLVIAVAVFRYDLAAVGADARRRRQTFSAVLLGLCVVSVLAVAAWSLVPQGNLVLAIALAAVVVPAALLITPLKRFPAWVTRRVLLSERDPEALRERVRMYATTLRAATGPDGRPVAAAEPALAALREQLGLAQRDHDLLLAMGGDQRSGGVVAYRLALASAAAEAVTLDDGQLAGLREELNVTERDHALVVEHLEASAESLSPGALFLGRYHVLRRLAEGGLSEVWLAHDTREKVDVVLKHLAGSDRRDGAAWQRIQKEVRAARVLTHPNVVAVRDVETIGNETYLVMEHMAGGSLADALRSRGRLTEAEVAQLAGEILDALGALHARGFVHRDVKPANILLDAKGVAKLGDFNVARELVSGETLGGGARGPVGTFAYMPPEQARGLAARPQSDLYGLAATLYEAIAGAPLLQLTGLSHTEAVTLISQHPPPASVPHASPPLAAAITRALARMPEDRFADAAAMKAAISPAETREGFDPPR